MLLLRTSKNTFLKVFKQSQNIAKPKELWQTSKSLGLPNKKEFSFECLKNKNSLLFDSMSTVETSKTYYSSLAENLVLKLPKSPNNFVTQLVNNYYMTCDLKERLLFSKIEQDKGNSMEKCT